MQPKRHLVPSTRGDLSCGIILHKRISVLSLQKRYHAINHGQYRVGTIAAVLPWTLRDLPLLGHADRC